MTQPEPRQQPQEIQKIDNLEERIQELVNSDEYHNDEAIIQSAKDIVDWAKDRVADPLEETFENENEDIVRSILLGSVFSLYPSGKYYMPFACSNVDECPLCKWKGVIETNEKIIECPFCNGVSSREAYEDEIYIKALNDAAEAIDCYVTSGEGDPCDIFIQMVVTEYNDRDDLSDDEDDECGE